MKICQFGVLENNKTMSKHTANTNNNAMLIQPIQPVKLITFIQSKLFHIISGANDAIILRL